MIAISYGQNFQYKIITGIDCRNATFGSEQTNYKAALNYTLGAEIQYASWIIGAEFESFKKLGYESQSLYSGVNVYLSVYKPTKLRLLVYPEVNLIWRTGDRESPHFSYGTNIELRYPISETILLGIRYNDRWRSDIKIDNYDVDSVYLRIIIAPKKLRSTNKSLVGNN